MIVLVEKRTLMVDGKVIRLQNERTVESIVGKKKKTRLEKSGSSPKRRSASFCAGLGGNRGGVSSYRGPC